LLLADTGFVGTLLLFIIFAVLVVLWAFVLMDLFRRKNLEWWHKALWLFLIIILPFLGALIYLAARPVMQEDIELQRELNKQKDYTRAAKAAEKLYSLSALRDGGRISQDEFEKRKARILAGM